MVLLFCFRHEHNFIWFSRCLFAITDGCLRACVRACTNVCTMMCFTRVGPADASANVQSAVFLRESVSVIGLLPTARNGAVRRQPNRLIIGVNPVHASGTSGRHATGS